MADSDDELAKRFRKALTLATDVGASFVAISKEDCNLAATRLIAAGADGFGVPVREMQSNPDCPNCGKGYSMAGSFNGNERSFYHMTANGFSLHHVPLSAAPPAPTDAKPVEDAELREIEDPKYRKVLAEELTREPVSVDAAPNMARVYRAFYRALRRLTPPAREPMTEERVKELLGVPLTYAWKYPSGTDFVWHYGNGGLSINGSLPTESVALYPLTEIVRALAADAEARGTGK